MQVADVMTKEAQYMAPDASLKQVAQKMRELDSGFVPVSDAEGKKLAGVVTDRDITIRAVSQGMNPDTTKASDIMSTRVAFCFANDDLNTASDKMKQKGIYRLIVLDDDKNKNLCGIISLGDILRHDQERMAAETAKKIASKPA